MQTLYTIAYTLSTLLLITTIIVAWNVKTYKISEPVVSPDTLDELLTGKNHPVDWEVNY